MSCDQKLFQKGLQREKNIFFQICWDKFEKRFLFLFKSLEYNLGSVLKVY